MNNHTTDTFSTRIADIVSTFNTDTIFILGKGPSADLVKPEVLAASLVIGINDAERIIPADISIFHENWVANSIRKNGERSRLYVTSTDFQPRDAQSVYAPYLPIKQDAIDFMFQRLLGDEVVIEEVMFLTALQICKKISALRNRTQKVYMVGFDFSPDLGSSSSIPVDYSRASADLRHARIRPQENYLLNALYILRDSSLDIIHVGTKPYSRATAEQLNLTTAVRANTYHQEAHQHAVSVVAEITTNHFGDRYRIERIIRAAKAAGADYVKFQKRDVDTFYTPDQLKAPYKSPFGSTFADYRHAIELDATDFEFVDVLCKQTGIGWFVSVLDKPSFEFIQRFDPQLIKLPSTISEHRDYLEFVAKAYRKGVVISTGMTDAAYEEWVLDTFKGSERIYLLQCNSAYPTPLDHCNIGVVRHYHALSRDNSCIVPGYSSHDIGWHASALAVAAGARMVEKHVKLGNTEWAHFDAVALDLTTDEFPEYVRRIREAETITGCEEKSICPCETHKYRNHPIEIRT